jgi:AcrR family transcriptional regulator
VIAPASTTAPAPDAPRATAAQVRRRPATDGRTRRAVATRAKIAAAATTLFVEQGYATTTIAAVARAAGVGVQTVYYSYASKAEILVGAIDHAIDGADARAGSRPDPAEQPWVQTALAAEDPARRLFLHVRGAADLLGRAGPLLDVVRVVAAGESLVQAAWQEQEERRRAAHRALIASYPEDGGHRDVEQAVDVAALTLGPEAWDALVRRGGWSGLAWTRWAHRTLLAELMPSRWEPGA